MKKSFVKYIVFFFQSKGENIPLTEYEGTDVIGNIIQSSMLSVNREYYGDLNGMGHMVIAYCHDPHNKFLVSRTHVLQY